MKFELRTVQFRHKGSSTNASALKETLFTKGKGVFISLFHQKRHVGLQKNVLRLISNHLTLKKKKKKKKIENPKQKTFQNNKISYL